MKFIYQKLQNLLNKTQKKYLLLLVFFSFFLAAVETVSLSSLVGFLMLVSDPEVASQKIPFDFVKLYLLSLDYKNLVIFLSILIILVFVAKNLFLVLFYYLQERLVKNIYINLAKDTFNTYLLLPYKFHVSQNASVTINSINSETKRTADFLVNLSMILKESITILFLFILMFFTNYKIAIFLFLMMLVTSLIFYKSIADKVKRIGIKVRINSEKILQKLTEAISSIKILKLANKNQFFIQNVFKEMARKQNNEIAFKVIGKLPRLILEILAVIVVVSILMFFMFNNINIKDSIPILSLVTLIILRTLPAYTNVNVNLNALRFNIKSVENISDLKEKFKNIKNFKENDILKKNLIVNEIELKNLTFNYNSKKIFNKINLKLESNKIYGIKGESGSGKTTLIDLILGLLEPQSGEILINGEKMNFNNFSGNYYASYVPQEIYLNDTSLAENIAFGINLENIDLNKLGNVIKVTQLNNLVNNLPNGFKSNIGEKGVKLSGGQRQRIGLARALYEDKSLLVLDESTSSLDYETEDSIIKEIIRIKKNKIIILVAHRLKTLEVCDKIISVSKSGLVKN